MNLVESEKWTLYDYKAVCVPATLVAYMQEKDCDYLLIDRADDYLLGVQPLFWGGLAADMPATLYRFEGAQTPPCPTRWPRWQKARWNNAEKTLFNPRQTLVLASPLAVVLWLLRCLAGSAVMLNTKCGAKCPVRAGTGRAYHRVCCLFQQRVVDRPG